MKIVDTISVNGKPIGLAADHAGYELKSKIIKLFEENNIKYIDFGTYGPESVDYPDFAHKLADAIVSGECDFGVTACGTGNGINIAMNRHAGIRSGLCWTVEIAKLVREHNNANALSIPARFVTDDEAIEMIKVFFNTPFEGGRHQKRIDKIDIR